MADWDLLLSSSRKKTTIKKCFSRKFNFLKFAIFPILKMCKERRSIVQWCAVGFIVLQLLCFLVFKKTTIAEWWLCAHTLHSKHLVYWQMKNEADMMRDWGIENRIKCQSIIMDYLLLSFEVDGWGDKDNQHHSDWSWWNKFSYSLKCEKKENICDIFFLILKDLSFLFEMVANCDFLS